ADHVHAFLDCLVRDFLGRREQRADFHVESNIGEGARDHFLPAIMAVLTHLGDENARWFAFGFLKRRHTLARTLYGDIAASLAREYARHQTDRRLVAIER